MADFFKGLAGGFGTGLQFGQAMRQRRMEDDLAQAYAKPEEFTDYTPEQQRQIRDLQASGAYDVSAVPGAEGAAPTLRYAPRRGLNLQGDVPAEGAYIDVAPQQVQRYGGQTMAGRFDPTQLRGLQMQEAARVLGSYGDVRGAAALQAQAAEQEFQAKYRPLLLQSTEGQIAGQGLTQEAQRLTITEAQKKVKQDESNRLAGTRLAELAAAGTPIDTATANRIAKETGADMTFVTDAVLKQYSLTKASANDLIERQLAEFDKAAKGGLPTLNKYIAERLDPDKTDNIVPTVVQGPDGKLRVMYGDKPLPGYQAYGGIDQLSAAFQGNIKRDPLGAAIQISTLDTQAQARLASQAQIRSSDSAVALRSEQLQMLKKQAAGNAEAQKIRTEYEALTPEEQVGAKGQGLIRQFNMANIKAGTPIPLGAAARPEFTPKDYAATIKSFTDAGFSQTDALIRADQLYGRAPADANVDAGLQKANAEKGAKTPAATTRRGPGDLSTVAVEKIRADATALDAAITQAQAQASAVVRSGDVNAIKLYGDRLNALRAQRAALTEGLTAAAVQTLGLK